MLLMPFSMGFLMSKELLEESLVARRALMERRREKELMERPIELEMVRESKRCTFWAQNRTVAI